MTRWRARIAASAAGASTSPRTSARTQKNVPPQTMGTFPRARMSASAASASFAQPAASIASSGSCVLMR
jgi:hypothetical protein